jgi:hypothetical protein
MLNKKKALRKNANMDALAIIKDMINSGYSDLVIEHKMRIHYPMVLKRADYSEYIDMARRLIINQDNNE